MNRNPRGRFWVEGVLAILSTVLGAVTLIRNDWIEALLHTGPDQGNGSLEWLIVGAAAAIALGSVAAAWREWRLKPVSA